MQNEKIEPEHTLELPFHPYRNKFEKEQNMKDC